MKKFVYTLIAAMVTVCAFAAAPNSSGTYYQNANGKKGSALKTAMCGIIYSRTEKSYDYLWTAFHTTDVRSDGKIWDMYSDNTNYVPGGSAQGANYSKEGDSYNREHSFPKSWFGGEVMPMYTDLHHMYPTDGYVNNKRGNYPFGETNGNTYKSHNSFSKLGTCTVSGYTGTVFEPADEYKGDFARTYFYMITCYEEKLADWYAGNADGVRATIDGSTYPGFQTWQLNMLLAWAAADPVSQKEIDRNTAVKNIQGNRNPFIDYPGLEQYIWGSMKDDTFSYDNYVQPTTWSTEYGSGSGSGSGGGGSGGDSGSDVADALTVAGWANYTENSYSAAGTDRTGTGSTTGVSYAMQVYYGSNGAVRGNQSTATNNYSCRNTSTYDGYYIKEVKLTVTGGTIDGSTSGRSVVYFGTSAFTTSPSGTATTSNENASGQSTLTWTNTDTSKNYFILYNLKTSGTAASAVVTITWALKEPPAKPAPTFNNLSDLSVNFGSTLTLTQGTTGTPNFVTDGTVTLESENTNVVTVDGLTITPVAVGTALITVNTSSTSAYNAGSIMFPITVNAPEGGTMAMPAESGLLFGETFGNNASSARTWTDSYSVKSGISSVYSDIASYTITNAKQSKNNVGSTASGLIQSTTGTDASIIIGPLNVADYSNLNLTYQWNAGSTKGTYTTKTYYATSSTGSYTEVPGTGTGATSFVERSYSLPAAAQVSTLYLKIVWNTSNTGAIIDEVQLSGTSSASLTATLNSSGYATYCSEYPLDFSDYATADYSAWQITDISGTNISFSQVTGAVKGGTGLLLKGTPNATVTLTSVNSSTELTGNLLNGTLAPTYVAIGEAYGLSGNKFVVNNAAGTISIGKAYLPASTVDGGSEVKSFTFVFKDADGIDTIAKSQEPRANGQIYNLAGQRLSKMQKGINIVNGKKVLVK